MANASRVPLDGTCAMHCGRRPRRVDRNTTGVVWAAPDWGRIVGLRGLDRRNVVGQSQSTITRREILKRGVIVGGGVLWITPVVQTLGMGPAFAAPVSGEACKMTVRAKDCVAGTPGEARFVFEVCIPPGCACNPRDTNTNQQVVLRSSAHSGGVYGTGPVPDKPGCHEQGDVSFVAPATIWAQCVEIKDFQIVRVVAESDPFEVTQDMINRCAT